MTLHSNPHIYKHFPLRGWAALCGIVLIVLACILVPIFSPYQPDTIDLSKQLAPIDKNHWLGCDHLGRDIFTRLIYGAYISLGASACIITLVIGIGICVGGVAGMLGGAWDRIIMRVCDVFLSVPTMILALFFVGVLGTGLLNVIIAITLTHWAFYARIARSLTLSLRSKEYIAISYMQGQSFWQSFWHNVLPSLCIHTLVLATMDMGHIMLHIAGLSFIGLGVQPPLAEWGLMLSDMKDYLYSAPQLLLYPGGVLCITIALFAVLGDSLKRFFTTHLEDVRYG